MNFKILFLPLLMFFAPVSSAQFLQTQEETELADKIDAEDWTYIRAYVNREELPDGSVPDRGFVMNLLMLHKADVLVTELIQTGILTRLDQTQYLKLIDTAMYSDNLDIAELLLEQYPYPPSSLPHPEGTG